MHNNNGAPPNNTKPPEIGVLFKNTNKWGKEFVRGFIKRKDGTKFELYGEYFEREGKDRDGNPEIKKYFSLSPYVKNLPGQPQPPVEPARQAQMAPAVASSPVPQTVKIDDDIPF